MFELSERISVCKYSSVLSESGELNVEDRTVDSEIVLYEPLHIKAL